MERQEEMEGIIISNQERCHEDIIIAYTLQNKTMEELKEASTDRSNKAEEILNVMRSDDEQLIQNVKELEARQEIRNVETKKELVQEMEMRSNKQLEMVWNTSKTRLH
jgi:hypothetical protein